MRGSDRDTQQVTGAGFARSDETFIEATYQYVPFDWWQIQPDIQYVLNPGAGIANPDATRPKRYRNEADVRPAHEHHLLSARTMTEF